LPWQVICEVFVHAHSASFALGLHDAHFSRLTCGISGACWTRLITMTAAGTALGVLAVEALPDMRRYVAMRKM
jgi:hypothetical protein